MFKQQFYISTREATENYKERANIIIEDKIRQAKYAAGMEIINRYGVLTSNPVHAGTLYELTFDLDERMFKALEIIMSILDDPKIINDLVIRAEILKFVAKSRGFLK